MRWSPSLHQARKDTTQQLLSSLGPHAAFISSAEHDDIIAGQGTVAMEFLDQVTHHMTQHHYLCMLCKPFTNRFLTLMSLSALWVWVVLQLVSP